jgi:hypothetical protein
VAFQFYYKAFAKGPFAVQLVEAKMEHQNGVVLSIQSAASHCGIACSYDLAAYAFFLKFALMVGNASKPQHSKDSSNGTKLGK